MYLGLLYRSFASIVERTDIIARWEELLLLGVNLSVPASKPILGVRCAMFCPKCSSKNPADKKFCGDCGAPLEAPAEAVPVPGDPGAFFCARHKKVATRVR